MSICPGEVFGAFLSRPMFARSFIPGQEVERLLDYCLVGEVFFRRSRSLHRSPAPYLTRFIANCVPSFLAWLFFPQQRPAPCPTRGVSSPGGRRPLRSRSRKTATSAAAVSAVGVSPTSVALVAAAGVAPGAAAAGSCVAWLPLALPAPPHLRLPVVLRFPTRVHRVRGSKLEMVRKRGAANSCCGRLERSRKRVAAAGGWVAAAGASRQSGSGLAPALDGWPRLRRGDDRHEPLSSFCLGIMWAESAAFVEARRLNSWFRHCRPLITPGSVPPSTHGMSGGVVFPENYSSYTIPAPSLLVLRALGCFCSAFGNGLEIYFVGVCVLPHTLSQLAAPF